MHRVLPSMSLPRPNTQLRIIPQEREDINNGYV
jgi:hypothetical protein